MICTKLKTIFNIPMPANMKTIKKFQNIFCRLFSKKENIVVIGDLEENSIFYDQISTTGKNAIHFWRDSTGNEVNFGEKSKCSNLNIHFWKNATDNEINFGEGTTSSNLTINFWKDSSGNEVNLGAGTTSSHLTVNFWKNSTNNEMNVAEGFTCTNLKIVFKGHNNELRIGKNVRLRGHILIVGSRKLVEIGDNTTAQGVYILSRDADVSIGRDCMFSREIEIRSTDVHKIYDRASGTRLNVPRDVEIGNNVWVAARAMISKGAKIPNGCVVGAASFVNKPFVEENCIIAGVPAQITKRNIRWER